jgi:aerobic carbon-monoxide dehydrogenase large subunit
MDPVELRRRNLPPSFSAPHPNGAGATYDSGDYVAALDMVLAAGVYPALRAENPHGGERPAQPGNWALVCPCTSRSPASGN